MPVSVIKGDLFSSKQPILVNTVNCVGVMGKGIALGFKQRYPKMFEEYKMICDREEQEFFPGQILILGDNPKIFNAATKDHWKSPSQLPWIIEILARIVAIKEDGKIAFDGLATPLLGCGNGGLDPNIVRPIMIEILGTLNVPVEIYEKVV